MEHCIRKLKPAKDGKKGGRAAIIVPDNVLFEDGRGQALRRMLMNWCDLHTVLRLPTGIFYAQGVKTNVIFFTRGKTQEGNTPDVWVYDLRAQMPSFGKTNPLTELDLAMKHGASLPAPGDYYSYEPSTLTIKQLRGTLQADAAAAETFNKKLRGSVSN